MLELETLTKRFLTAGGAVSVVDRLSVSLAAEQAIALVGPSGCGKSTLLQLIAGLIAPDEGAVRLNGRPPTEYWSRGAIGLALQTPALLNWRTVVANLSLLLELNRTNSAQLRSRLDETLALFDLTPLADRLPSQLSGGQQQRVSVARALVTSPALLLLDEPFSALDEFTREQLQTILFRVLRQQKPRPLTIFVTHSIPEAVYLADRVLIMRSGQPTELTEFPVLLPKDRDAELRDEPVFHQAVAAVRKLLRTPAEQPPSLPVRYS